MDVGDDVTDRLLVEDAAVWRHQRGVPHSAASLRDHFESEVICRMLCRSAQIWRFWIQGWSRWTITV